MGVWQLAPPRALETSGNEAACGSAVAIFAPKSLFKAWLLSMQGGNMAASLSYNVFRLLTILLRSTS